LGQQNQTQYIKDSVLMLVHDYEMTNKKRYRINIYEIPLF